MAERPARAPRRDIDSQLVVSLAVVAALLILGIGLMVTAVILNDKTLGGVAIGTIIGALATALNAPNGIANALKATKPTATVSEDADGTTTTTAKTGP